MYRKYSLKTQVPKIRITKVYVNARTEMLLSKINNLVSNTAHHFHLVLFSSVLLQVCSKRLKEEKNGDRKTENKLPLLVLPRKTI